MSARPFPSRSSIAALLVVLCLLGACARREPEASTAEPTRVSVVRPHAGTLWEETIVVGTTNAVVRAEVDAAASGLVTRIAVRPGDRVTAGRPLFWVEPSDAAARVAEQKATVAAARSRVASLAYNVSLSEKKDADAVDVAEQAVRQARIAVEEQKLELRSAREDLADKELLFKEGAVAFKQVRIARLQAEREAATLRLKESALRVAQEDLEEKRSTVGGEVGAARAELEAARAELEEAEAALRAYELSVTRTVVRAPLSGVVVQMNVAIGQMVGASRGGLVTIVDPTSYKVEGVLDQRYAALIGRDAVIHVSSNIHPDRVLEGRLDELVPNPDPKMDTVTVRVNVREASKYLIEGAKVRLKIKIPHTGWILPKSALIHLKGRHQAVQLVRDGRIVTTVVHPEYVAVKEFVVKKGLSDEDEVAVDADRSLADGERVVPEARR